MLTDQIFPRPIAVVIGPEVFYEENALRLNMERIRAFQESIVPSGMYQFYYVQVCPNRKKLETGKAYSESLRVLGIPHTPIILLQGPDYYNNRLLRDLAFGADIVFRVAV